MARAGPPFSGGDFLLVFFEPILDGMLGYLLIVFGWEAGNMGVVDVFVVH